jgi:hypothetical protein
MSRERGEKECRRPFHLPSVVTVILDKSGLSANVSNASTPDGSQEVGEIIVR